MGRVVVGILAIFGIWMLWWAIGQFSHQKGLEAWIDARRAEGWVADVGELDTVGFPSRFDTTLTEVNLADPATGVAWAAPFVQFLSLAYKPTQVIAVLPQEHRFSTPLQTMTIAHSEAKASLFLKPSTSLALDRARLVVDTLEIGSNLGWDVTLREGRFAAEDIGADNVYRVGAEVLELRPSEDMRDLLDPAGLLPDAVESLRLDATLGFDAPWDRNALEDARPQVRTFELTNLSARWGDVTFRAAGDLVVDDIGVPEGRITIKAVEWRQMLQMAVNAGLVPEAFVTTAESGLGLLAALSGDPDTIDVPLGFSGGRMSLGPVPLGPAPLIVIR
ncbi:MAG: DUF2125 domain-containing protein [Silicimonas sp.]|nr:DUF2125 domain-containing protein [Silicimonas sp.]